MYTNAKFLMSSVFAKIHDTKDSAAIQVKTRWHLNECSCDCDMPIHFCIWWVVHNKYKVIQLFIIRNCNTILSCQLLPYWNCTVNLSYRTGLCLVIILKWVRKWPVTVDHYFEPWCNDEFSMDMTCIVACISSITQPAL